MLFNLGDIVAEDITYSVDELRRVLHQNLNPCYDNTSKTEVYVRCPNCGDSKKNKSAAHFYIKMKPPFSCYCQRCQYSGKLNKEMLEKLQIYDNTTVLNITNMNKVSGTDNNIQYVKKTINFDYTDNPDDLDAQASLNYFNTRFGVNETIESLNKRFKCICNPKAFLEQNNVDISKSKFDFSKSIGFISSDNKYIICRDITGQQEFRYSNTALSEDEDKSKIYNIKRPVNMLSDKITLVITEGIFDCIGIYYKMYNNDSDTTIIAAGCGKSYAQVIEKYLRMGFLNLDIQIFADADVDISFFTKLKKSKYYLKNSNINVYYNTLGKDCGTTADQISLTKHVI